MRAILIDPFAETVTEVDDDFADDKMITKHIQCGQSPFTAMRLGTDVVLYLDNEGLLKPNQKFFLLDTYPQPLAGRGIVLGCDAAGETTPLVAPFPRVAALIYWAPPLRVVGFEVTEETGPIPALGGVEGTIIRSVPKFEERNGKDN